MSDQAFEQSSTVDSAAEAMQQSGIIDNILGETDEGQPEREAQESEVEETEDEDVGEEPTEEEGEEEESPEEDENGEQSEEEGESVTLESIDKLAETLEVSKDDLLDNLKLEVVVDGEKQEVSLRDAAKGYQMESDYRRKTADLANKRRELEATQQEEAKKVEYQHQIAAQVLLQAERELYGELQSVNFEQLQKEDPVQWATRYAQLQQRQQQINAVKQQAQQAYAQQHQELQQKQQQAIQQRIAEETEALNNTIPNFSEVKPQLDDYLSNSYGYTNDELTSVIDHRIVDIARKAMLYDQQQESSKKALKTVKKKPKMIRSTKATKPASGRDNYRSAKAKARKTGHIRDAAAAIENLL